MSRFTSSHTSASKFRDSTTRSTASRKDSRKASYDEKIRKECTRVKEQLKCWTQNLADAVSSLGEEGKVRKEEERERRKNAADDLGSLLICLRRIREDQLGLFMQPGESLLEKVQSRSSKEKREKAKPEPDEVLEVLKGFQDEIDIMIDRVEKVKTDADMIKKAVHTKADLREVYERANIEYEHALELLSNIRASKEFQDCKMKVYP